MVTHRSQSLYSSSSLAQTHTLTGATWTRCGAEHTKSYVHEHNSRTQTPGHTHTHTVFSWCVFLCFSCHLVRVRHPRLQLWLSERGCGGGGCITMYGTTSVSTRSEFQITTNPLFLPVFPSTAASIFLRYDPFRLLSSARLPSPSPPFYVFPAFVFLPFLSLYKVFQIYHLYIMMYGYDNVLYYGKMRKIYFCYRFVS